jgi:hypothetical protein
MIYKESLLNGQPSPNLFDYFINRNKAIDFNELRFIAEDLLQIL